MNRRTILLAGELGAGLGHAMPLFRISEALHKAAETRGMALRCVFALHDPSLLHEMKRPGDLVLQAPSAPQRGELRSHTGSYAEVLVASGFAHPDVLRRSVASWDDLFQLVKPALVVADHSPTAVLAARGHVPVLVTGNGFTVPPASIDAFPAMIAGRSAPAIQTRLRDNVNAVLAARDLAPVERLPEFLRGDARAIFTVPDLDPYGRLRDTPLAGLYEGGVEPSPLPAEKRVFLYGHASIASFPVLVRAALETGVPVSAYLTGASEELSFLLRQRGAEVFATAPALGEILPRMSLVVSNGGAGLSHAALAAGRPHVLCPIHTESQMTARALARLGCAVTLENPTLDTAEAAIRDAANDEALAGNCLRKAEELQATLPRLPLEMLAAQCLERIEAEPQNA